MAINTLIIDGESLTLENIETFLKENQKIELSEQAKINVNRSRALIDKWVESGEVIYGVTTG